MGDTSRYDLSCLLCDVFPILKDLQESEEQGVWGDAWALPEAHSRLVSGVQGRWTNKHTTYRINGKSIHVTRGDGSCALTQLVETENRLWWAKHWRISDKDVTK